ncbi:MAG: hypothetical protein PHD60_06215, partial [Clostridia bacterium]|nr:hypothetical protein [Clostridia bacterium]
MNKKKTPIIGMAIALTIICSIVCGCASSGFIYSNRQNYLKIEEKNITNLAQSLIEEYNSIVEWIEPYLENTVCNSAELSISVKGTDNSEPFLEKGKVMMVSESNSNEQYYYDKYTFDLENIIDFGGLETVVDKKMMGFRFPGNGKYLAFNLADRDQFESYYLPKRVLMRQELIDAVKITPEEVKVLSPYIRLYFDSIEGKQVTIEKEKGPYTYLTQEGNKSVTVNFNSDELSDLINKCLEKMVRDEDLLNLLCDKYNSVYTLLTESGYLTADSNLKKMSKEEIRNVLKGLVDNKVILDDIDSLSRYLYVYEDNDIIISAFTINYHKTKVSYKVLNDTISAVREWEFAIQRDIEDNKNDNKISLKLSGTDCFDWHYLKGKNGDVSIEFNDKGKGISFIGDYLYNVDEKKDNGELSFSYTRKDEKISGEMKKEIKKNPNEKSQEGLIRGEINLNIPKKQIKGVVINIDGKCSEVLGKPIDQISLDSNNSRDIRDISNKQSKGLISIDKLRMKVMFNCKNIFLP